MQSARLVAAVAELGSLGITTRHMQTEPTRSRFRRRFAVTAGVVAFYLLSVGPSEWLWKRGFVSESVLRVVYFPLLAVDGTRLERPLAWYCELWVGRATPCCPDEVAESIQR